MTEQLDTTGPKYWTTQITPELRRKTELVIQKIDTAIEAIVTAKPTHPLTGEVGTFVRFYGGSRVRALYRTESGLEFFNPTS